jgi:hypothetical protein
MRGKKSRLKNPGQVRRHPASFPVSPRLLVAAASGRSGLKTSPASFDLLFSLGKSLF